MYIFYITVNYVSIVLLVIFKDVKLLIKDNEELPFGFSKIHVQEIFDALLIVNYVSIVLLVIFMNQNGSAVSLYNKSEVLLLLLNQLEQPNNATKSSTYY